LHRDPITLTRPELWLDIRDDHEIPLPEADEPPERAIDAIVSALSEALKRCRGPEEAWMAMNLRTWKAAESSAGRPAAPPGALAH